MAVGSTMARLVHEFEFDAVPSAMTTAPPLPIPSALSLPLPVTTPLESLRTLRMSRRVNGSSPILSVFGLPSCTEPSAWAGQANRRALSSANASRTASVTGGGRMGTCRQAELNRWLGVGHRAPISADFRQLKTNACSAGTRIMLSAITTIDVRTVATRPTLNSVANPTAPNANVAAEAGLDQGNATA